MPTYSLFFSPSLSQQGSDMTSYSLFSSSAVSQQQVSDFLTFVAQGKQDEAEQMLKNISPKDAQQLLLAQDACTDYQGRTFNCSAFGYAWWAKDRRMLTMLLQYMTDDTKAIISGRVDSIETHGLTYQQNDDTKNSKHFDFQPLIKALEDYPAKYKAWSNMDQPISERLDTDPICIAENQAWFAISQAQREAPAHVIHEICRAERSFLDPEKLFEEPTLSRQDRFHNFNTATVEYYFAKLLTSDDRRGIVLLRGVNNNTAKGGQEDRPGKGLWNQMIAFDLPAMVRLDEVRTQELEQLRESLPSPQENTASSACQIM